MGKKWEKQSPKFHILDWEHWRLPSGNISGLGCKINASANLFVLGGLIFQFIPSVSSVLSHLQHIIDRKIVRGVAIVGFGR